MFSFGMQIIMLLFRLAIFVLFVFCAIIDYYDNIWFVCFCFDAFKILCLFLFDKIADKVLQCKRNDWFNLCCVMFVFCVGASFDPCSICAVSCHSFIFFRTILY